MNPDHILAAATHADPYPYYAGLVAGAPMIYDTAHSLWIASSAAGVKAVLANPDCHVRPPAEPVLAAIAGSAAGEVFGCLVRMNDGPTKHQTPKLVLQRFLAGVDLGLLQRRTRAISAAAIARNSQQGGAGLNHLMTEIPVMAMADFLGFEEAELAGVAMWMGEFVACLSPLSNGAQLEGASDAADLLLERLAQLAATAHLKPEGALARIKHEAAQAGWQDSRALLANLVGLLSQTYEATAGLIGNSIVALARQKGLRDTVNAIPDRAGGLIKLVQEVSRHDPSIQHTRRFVVRPTDMAGTQLAAGDIILVVLAAASRDPLCNPDPDAFLLDRSDRDNPGFGHGRHQCPGETLACTIAAAGLGTLLDSDALHALPGSWSYRPSLNARIPVFAD